MARPLPPSSSTSCAQVHRTLLVSVSSRFASNPGSPFCQAVLSQGRRLSLFLDVDDAQHHAASLPGPVRVSQHRQPIGGLSH